MPPAAANEYAVCLASDHAAKTNFAGIGPGRIAIYDARELQSTAPGYHGCVKTVSQSRLRETALACSTTLRVLA
jgi:hypothetical protein